MQCGRRIAASGILTSNSGQPEDVAQVHRSLSQAWGTELLLSLTRTLVIDEEFIRVSNTWVAVQTYYAMYHSTQAVAVACGVARPVSHPATQRQFHHLWGTHSSGVLPWSLAARNNGFVHLPTGASVQNIHPWTRCTSANALNLACMALRTTREDKVPEAVQKARERKRSAARRAWEQEEAVRLAHGKRARKSRQLALPRLTDDELQTTVSAVPPTTLLDYLYRLRIRANYEDTAVFVDGPESSIQSRMFRRDLCLVASTTMLLSELAISQLIGRAQLLKWVDRWLRNSMPRNTRVGLFHRRDVLAGLT